VHILEPSERTRNPYSPIGRALKTLKMEITDMVQVAIKEIDKVIQGTVDQAIEDVRMSTQKDIPCPQVPSTPSTNGPTPTVTPEKTFRGRTVRINEPPPRQEFDQHHQKEFDYDCSWQNDKYDQSRNHIYNDRHIHDDYDRSRDEYRKQRDQEYFLKGHVEASLETLKEDNMNCTSLRIPPPKASRTPELAETTDMVHCTPSSQLRFHDFKWTK
jgi:hypothetical protein